MPLVAPIVTPQFVRFSSHEVRLVQFAESPPKLNPTYGVMNPSARAGAAVDVRSAAASAPRQKMRIIPPEHGSRVVSGFRRTCSRYEPAKHLAFAIVAFG